MKDLHANQASGNHKDALLVEVAWFRYMKATKPKARRLGEVLDDVQSGAWRVQIERLRVIRAAQGEDTYNREKEKLPSFYMSGKASTPTKMLTHSSVIQVDLDHLSDRLAAVRAR